MKNTEKIIEKWGKYDSILVLNKYGYWLRVSGENPGTLIKAVNGIPSEKKAVEHAIKILKSQPLNFDLQRRDIFYHIDG